MLKRSILLFMMICLGCGSQNAATDGKVVITSTKGFAKTKASKSPPAHAPKQ